MNDLEIIKYWKTFCVTDEPAALKKIVEAAERMANRIAELEKENIDQRYEIENLNMNYEMMEDSLKKDLACEKSKNCGRCKWMNDCYKEVRLIGDTMDDFEGITFCSFFREAASGSE